MVDRAEALLLIDLQIAYFVDAELARCRDDLVEATNRLLEAAEVSTVPVVELRTEHDPSGSTWTLSMLEDGVGPAMAGTPGAEPVAGLRRREAAVMTKTRDSAFFGTGLAAHLQALGVRRVVLAGVSTESCLVATAGDAFAHDLRVTIVSDATASVEWSLHDESLVRLQHQYRQQVATADEVIAAWSQRTPRTPTQG